MYKKLLEISSFEGEMGRDDYWLSSLWRVSVYIILLIPFLIITNGIESETFSLEPEQVVQLIYYQGIVTVLGLLVLVWPPLLRRWHDLGGNRRLNKAFVGILFLNSLLPSYKEIDYPGIKVMAIAITLVSIYPAWLLSFSPGKKSAKLKKNKLDEIHD